MDPEFVPDPRLHQPAGPAPAQQYLTVGHFCPRKDVDVCVASGEIDLYTIPLLRGALREIETRGNPWIFVDLSHVTFLGVIGAYELSMAGTRTRARRQRMGLVVATHPVWRTLQVTGGALGLATYERLADGLARVPDTAGSPQL